MGVVQGVHQRGSAGNGVGSPQLFQLLAERLDLVRSDDGGAPTQTVRMLAHCLRVRLIDRLAQRRQASRSPDEIQRDDLRQHVSVTRAVEPLQA